VRDPLNFFEPYEALPPTHENQLTRGFLVVLKLVPIAHAVWFRLVSEARAGTAESLPPLERLPVASFQTQTGQVGSTATPDAGLDETSAYRAVSVLQANDLLPDETPAQKSERRAVFDGVVRYGDDLGLIIESKLDGRPDERQAREITIGETAWRVDPHRARLQWRDIIEAWRDLLLRDLVSGTERKVLEDFMWFVQRHFPQLQPFSELAACLGSHYLARLRCKAILDDLGTVPAELRPAGPPQDGTPTGASLLLADAHVVKLAGLESDGATQVRLRLFPGDTLEQAKILYSGSDRVCRLLSLREHGWEIWTNFHFGHTAKGFAWTNGSLGVDEYVSYWLGHIDAAGQIRRKGWKGYFDGLIELGIASESDREAFDRDFVATKRSSATPRPGLGVERQWSFEFAAELDRVQRFGSVVRDSINTVLDALGEPMI
jgi:hypothetical protein